jgi:hypothetical protein
MTVIILTRRFSTDSEQVLGEMEIYKNGVFVGKLLTLEKIWDKNKQQRSCIPFGLYDVRPFSGVTFKDVFEIVNVPNRSAILIHAGNYHTHTKGCVLVGLSYVDLNNDGLLDVGQSQTALSLLRDYLSDSTNIKILIR